MSSEAQAIFEELFFGAGKWLGLILIISIILVMCWRKKEASFLFIPINILWGLEYLDEITQSDPFFYAVIVFMFLPVFLAFDYLRGNH